MRYNCRMKGNKRLVIRVPPTMKQNVATKDGHCSVLIPIIACPDVQLPAYLEPKPIRNPPPIIMIKPLALKSDRKENNCCGTAPASVSMWYEANCFASSG